MTGGRLLLLCAALAAPLAVGCGSDVHYSQAADHRIEVRLAEYSITPEHIQVHAGRISVVAHDVGKLTHNLAVVQFNRPKSGEQEKQYGQATKTLFPGQTGSTTVDLQPGKYRLVCTLANHDNLGQWAELKVVP